MGNTPFPFFTHGTFVPSAPGFSCMRKQQPSSDPMRLAHVTSFPCPQGPPPSLYGPILKGILILLTINKVNKSLKEMDFSQAIHTFFSSQKNVNRLKEFRVSLEIDFVLPVTRFFPSRGNKHSFRFNATNFQAAPANLPQHRHAAQNASYTGKIHTNPSKASFSRISSSRTACSRVTTSTLRSTSSGVAFRARRAAESFMPFTFTKL